MSIQSENEPNEVQEKPERHPKFYIALLICLAAVSAAGWSTYKTVKEFITPQRSSSPRISKSKEKDNSKLKETSKSTILEDSEQKSEDASKQSAIPYDKKKSNLEETPKKATSKEETSKQEETQAVWAEKSESPEISYPGAITVTKEFSDDTPVYSKTLCDWRSHDGTDFKADKGSKIKSITSGTVTDVYEDPSYGTTVMVAHDGGFTAYYSGLEKNVLVKKGNKIKSSEEIGTIGEVPCEILDEPHLHLSINKNGKFIDPLLILDDKES